MVPEEAIRERSYAIWEREGRPEGKALEHWVRAKAQLEAERQPASKPLAPEYYTAFYRFEEWHRAVQPKPRITSRPRISMAARVSSIGRSAAA